MTDRGPKTARTIRRMEDHEKYDLDLLNKVVGRPIIDAEEEDSEEDADVDTSLRVDCPREVDVAISENLHEVKRRRKVTKEDIDKYGPTPGCLGCRTLKAGLPRQSHNENCRNRVEAEIQKTEEGRARVDRSNTRLTECIQGK